MKYKEITNHIVNWIENYTKKSGQKGLIIGISGGIDSAVCSKLCSMTKYPTLSMIININSHINQINRAINHVKSICNKKKDNYCIIDISENFDFLIKNILPVNFSKYNKDILTLAKANTKSRIIMSTLYYYACLNSYLVTGTGNKIEDFEIGFFTKYGDGGVDISPIADLNKSDIYKLAEYLKINKDIIEAKPTDGLFDKEIDDETQIGATYKELENIINKKHLKSKKREDEVKKIYKYLHKKNMHKFKKIPVCKIPKDYLL